MALSEPIRHQMVVLARRRKARVTELSRDRLTDWRPGQVLNPNGRIDSHFTDAAAWELIASELEDGHSVDIVELEKPREATGYVMRIDIEPDRALLYVKLQLGSGKIIGRSFHYSEHQD